eukprot:CAMPEP_0117029732 /NCGR_PEP_ID=MMETSP0472-20121206/21502_1 /TAXON_ID=693140 ORGANISM="Tiarina fusus, Strain LIS" /NCGR_SAMPLE_ID=MMETSP0472 /ASSEMBLY_ACC=CAM_ASM_000603 /LENGTH=258 /DNA_ID=CAMNT_0004737575 /DNA_START=132 /DNA_END=911 /DNA_ORIENTATION=+
MPATRKTKRKVAAKKTTSEVSTLFQSTPKKFGIGKDLPAKRDLTRFVRWPKYVRLQRQKRVLQQRLKVPPSVNQFTRTLDKNTATQVFKLMDKHAPETKKEKKQRLLEAAKAKVDGEKAAPAQKPCVVKYGLKHITALVEQKKALLVLIAHDVEPLELVIWLPALCRKMGVPYAIIKGKARLGQVVGKKTATAVAFTDVRKEDRAEFGKIVETIKVNFLDRYDELRKQWGGGRMGQKSNARKLKKEKAIAQESLPITA